jgi:hypothetical protein
MRSGLNRSVRRLAWYLRRRWSAAYTQQLAGPDDRVEPAIATSVKAWCQDQPAVTVEVIQAPEVTRRALPRTIEDFVDDRFYGIAGPETTIPEKYLARIPHARMVGDAGLVVLPDGTFASETTFGAQELVKQPAYFSPLPRRSRKRRGSYFSLVSLWAHQPNYYHWIHDSILRCHLILPHLPDDARFIVPPHPRPFQLDSLALLGISRPQLRPFRGHELWDLETLYFAPPTTSAGSNSPAASQWLRDLAWSAYGLQPARTKRIYISRRRAAYRRIVNEAEVEAVLREWGFETYLFEDMTFQEQVSLMAQAEAVVSASGAALTNLLFAPPGAKVFVMVEPVQISVYFWSMAEALGHEYWYAVGETVPGPPPPHDQDVRFPPAKVTRTLEEMFR